MAGIDYANLAKVAKRLINDNGRALTIILRNRTPNDPTMPWLGPDVTTSTTIDVIGVIGSNDEMDRKGDLPRDGKMSAYISAIDTDPALVEQYDLLTDGSSQWKITDVEIVQPGPLRIIYVLSLTA